MDPDRSDDPSPAHVRMSYQDLADRWGIGLDSARHKAKRRGWKVQLGNDGRAWVMVPAHTKFPPARSPDRSPDDPPTKPAPDPPFDPKPLLDAVAALTEVVARRDAENAELRAALEDERRKGLWTRIREAWGGR